jgi:hypothetical protein
MESDPGRAPPLPPKPSHQNYGEDERVSSVLPSRPPQPPSPKPPRPPKPTSANQEPKIDRQNSLSKRQPVIVDNLLNFGDDSVTQNQTGDINSSSTPDDFAKK